MPPLAGRLLGDSAPSGYMSTATRPAPATPRTLLGRMMTPLPPDVLPEAHELADPGPQATETVVLALANARALELGFDPQHYPSELLPALRPIDDLFLDDEGIEERHSLRAVNYAPLPPPQPSHGEFGVATAGGDLTVYVDVASRRVVAVWLGE